MQRLAFRMQLLKGFEEEYKRRHHEIWPELTNLLKGRGIAYYSIFLDAKTNSLFGGHKLGEGKTMEDLPNEIIMQKMVGVYG